MIVRYIKLRSFDKKVLFQGNEIPNFYVRNFYDIVAFYIPPQGPCPNSNFFLKFGFGLWTPYLFARCQKICSVFFFEVFPKDLKPKIAGN